MAFRFSRRIKLFPGVHHNLGLKSMSVSVGPRGAAVTVGPRGVHSHVGLPGTGLSYRKRLDDSTGDAARAPSAVAPDSIRIRFDDRLSMQLLDEDNSPLEEPVLTAARKAFRKSLLDALDARAAEINAAASPQDMHRERSGPAPDDAYLVAKPAKPADPRSIDPAHPDRAVADAAWANYMAELGPWRAGEAEHRRGASDRESIMARVATTLSAIAWPRETLVTLDVDGAVLRADVDLPEIEDLSSSLVTVARRDLALVSTPLSATARRRAYERHICGIACRIVGESFAASPAIAAVHIAGYTQSLSVATGAIDDVYVLAVTVTREDWADIDLGLTDPVSALVGFRRRSAVDSSGQAHTIVPLGRI